MTSFIKHDVLMQVDKLEIIGSGEDGKVYIQFTLPEEMTVYTEKDAAVIDLGMIVLEELYSINNDIKDDDDTKDNDPFFIDEDADLLNDDSFENFDFSVDSDKKDVLSDIEDLLDNDELTELADENDFDEDKNDKNDIYKLIQTDVHIT